MLKWQGDLALDYAAERIAALASAGDFVGVSRWQAITGRMQRIIEAPTV